MKQGYLVLFQGTVAPARFYTMEHQGLLIGEEASDQDLEPLEAEPWLCHLVVRPWENPMTLLNLSSLTCGMEPKPHRTKE